MTERTTLRESEIRPRELLDRYLALSAADAERLFSDAGAFAARPCPACGGDNPRPVFVKYGFSYARCGTCETLYADPAPRAEELAAFYRDSVSQRFWAEVFFPTVSDARRQKVIRPRIERLRRLVESAGCRADRIVDVGAGAGAFLDECRKAGFGCDHGAVEPSAPLARQCRELGLTTIEGFAEDAALVPKWASGADLVTSFEVIEHVLSPLAYMKALAALIRDGGRLVVTGLCGTGFDILTLGARAKAVSPPHHLNFISRKGAEILVKRSGLDLISFLTPGELDVDIVANATAEAPESVTEPFLRHLLAADAHTRDAFQRFLADNGLSSHMWLLCRRSQAQQT